MGPYGITQVDIPGILAAHETRQQRRMQMLMAERQNTREEQEFQRKQSLLTIFSRMRTPGKPGEAGQERPTGMAGAYSEPSAPALQPEAAPATAPPAPSAATANPAVPETWMAANREVVEQLMAVDPPQAFQMITAFRGMDKDQLEQVGAKNKAIGTAAQYLLSIPEDQWGAEMQERIAPWLLQSGVSQAQIAGFQLNQQNVKWAAAQARDIERLIDDTRVKWQPIGEGGAFALDAYGNPTGTGNPFASGFVPPGGGQAPAAPATGTLPSGVKPRPARAGIIGIIGDTETSGPRSAKRNKEVGGVPNSYHLDGRASDRTPPRGMSMAEFHRVLTLLNPDKDVINEGDHVHIEPKRRGQASAPSPPPGFVLD